MQDLCVKDFVARILGSRRTWLRESKGVGYPLDLISGMCRVSRP